MKRLPRIEVNCPMCETSFLVLESDLARGEGKFCSNECRLKATRVQREIRHCSVCGSPFEAKTASDQRTCSSKCGRASKHHWVTCVCGKRFIRRNPSHTFCSTKCAGRSKHNGVSIKCEWCGKLFEIPRSRLGKRMYCSKECCDRSQRTVFDEMFFFDETPEVAYWAGFLMADGGVQFRGET